ncbi:MAG: hypothetical protein NZ929_00920 [Aigarchaeota archaeon]|nr:hypothetical protein [Aigarchaeota archaeon]MCX8192218.1 hypothetical protein [Nitrososphaeria archaeon]MDW7986174.1 hypothetical protein [Nitrososphaerota archaeon]
MSTLSGNVKIEVESLEQLVLLSSVMPISLINVDVEKKMAFVFLQPLASTLPIIYFCKLDSIPNTRFIYLNRVTGKIRFGDEFSTEPNDITIPLIKIKSSNIMV